MKALKRLTTVLLITSMALALTGCKMTDYKSAQKLYDSGNYLEAAQTFKALGDYKDSSDKYNQASYSQAKTLYEAEDYEGALKIFNDLGTYSDASELSSQCRSNIDRKNIVGPWNSELDLTESFINGSTLFTFINSNTEFMQYCDFRFVLPITLIFNEDGTYETLIPVDSIKFFTASIVDGLLDGVKGYLMAETGKQIDSYNITLDDFIGALGDGVVNYLKEQAKAASDTLIDNVSDWLMEKFGGFDVRTMLDKIVLPKSFKDGIEKSLSKSGTFELNGGSVTFILGQQSQSFSYNLNSGKLELSSITGMTADVLGIVDKLPLIFKK